MPTNDSQLAGSKSGDKKDTRKSLSVNVRSREDALKVFKVPPRYVVQDVLGQGAYGIVVSAFDAETKETVAVKKIERVFDHETFTKRTLREIRILRLLKHENIISLKRVFASVKSNQFDDLYLVFDLMETDLANIIKSPQPLSGHHIQFFLYQILRGLKFLHSAGIIHRDIKPRNLLVNSNCDLKICDMGLARFDTGTLTSCPPMTDYVATRWYRAPEIILQWDGYSKAIDLWAVGCILAELIGRKPIFPGMEADHQITLICEVLGRPSPALIQRCPHPETIQFLEALPLKATHPLNHLYRQADIASIDLLNKLLRFDPSKRFSVSDCLKHPYLSQLHCPQDEPESPLLDIATNFPFDGKKVISSLDLRETVINEVTTLGRFYDDEIENGELRKQESNLDCQNTQTFEPRPPSDSPPPNTPSPLPPSSMPLVTTGRAPKTTGTGALVVHSPLLDSSQDSTVPHTPKTPSTPSNVSLELGRLGAAIDELRAM